MLLLRQGKAITPYASLGSSSIIQSITRSNNAFLASTVRDICVQPGLRQAVFAKQSISPFSTLNIRGRSVLHKNIHPMFSASRPTLVLPRTKLAACISTEAQRILDEVSGTELRKLIGPTDGVHQIGDLAALDLGTTWWPSDLMINLLEFCQVSSGLPWWGSIVLVTVMLRIALFPLMLKVTRNTAVTPYIAEPVKGLMEAAKEARASNNLREMSKTQADIWKLYGQWGYSPMVNFYGMIQIPFFFAMFRTCWRCSKAPVPGFETGGTLWFNDLIAIDPYFILPMISGITTAVTILLGQKDITTPPQGIFGVLAAVSPIMAIAMVPMLGYVQPASVFVYWTANNFCLLFQSLLFTYPRTRKLLGIMPAHHKTSTGRPARPGVIGFLQDRVDFTKLAFENYFKEAAERRDALKNVRIDKQGREIRDVIYETRKKGPADTKAAAAGKIEKLR